MPAPQTGDIVLYRDPKHGTSGHTGRVCRTMGHKVWVLPMQASDRPSFGGRSLRLGHQHIEGWWRAGARKRTPASLVRFEVPA